MNDPIRIIVAQRGWVFVGYVRREETEIVILHAKNIRRWGTTRGLGQLAEDGPTGETVLDNVGTARIHPLALVCQFDANDAKWERVLR